MKEVFCIAIRGRPVRTTKQQNNKTTKQQNNRTTEQQVELGSSKFMNCITTVAKDGMLLIKETENGTICGHIENREK